MKQPTSSLNLMMAMALATAGLAAPGCTTARVGACKDADPDCGTGGLTVRVFDDSSDARHGRPTARPVTSTLIRKYAGEDGPVATSNEAVWSISDLVPGKYALRISVGDQPGTRKTVNQSFSIDARRGKVVNVVVSDENAAVRRTLVSVGCVALAVAAIQQLMPSPLEGMFDETKFR